MLIERIINKVGYIETTIPNTFFNELLEFIKSYEFKGNYNRFLAGNIETEKKLDVKLLPDPIKNLIFSACFKYISDFGLTRIDEEGIKSYHLELTDSWVNFQKKGEYNPIHDHGGDLVFVIWLQIPYDLQNEFNHPSAKNSSTKVSSMFQFANIATQFDTNAFTLIPVDKSYEGKMIVFNAEMHHTVYPFFTSDDYRISMSGNLEIVPDSFVEPDIELSDAEKLVRVVFEENPPREI